jgi:hypothetical protein
MAPATTTGANTGATHGTGMRNGMSHVSSDAGQPNATMNAAAHCPKSLAAAFW